MGCGGIIVALGHSATAFGVLKGPTEPADSAHLAGFRAQAASVRAAGPGLRTIEGRLSARHAIVQLIVWQPATSTRLGCAIVRNIPAGIKFEFIGVWENTQRAILLGSQKFGEKIKPMSLQVISRIIPFSTNIFFGRTEYF